MNLRQSQGLTQMPSGLWRTLLSRARNGVASFSQFGGFPNLNSDLIVSMSA